MKSSVIVAICLAIAVQSAKLPEYLKKCKKSPDNGDCVAENEQAVIDSLIKNGGDTRFKLQGLSPVHVEKIDLKATPQLQINLTDVDFYGFDTITPTGGNIDGDTLRIKLHLQRMELVGKYDMDGMILMLPVKGQGTFNVTFVDYDVDYTTKLMVEERKGKKYYHVSDDNTLLKMINVKKVHFKFDNLFNGDPHLGPELNRFLNENWKDVFDEVRVSFEQTAAFSIVNYFVNGYFYYIPIEELYDNVK